MYECFVTAAAHLSSKNLDAQTSDHPSIRNKPTAGLTAVDTVLQRRTF